MELRAPLEFALLPSSLPWLLTAPRGDGHPVLLVPGFLSSEAPLLAMQAFLRNRGYTVDRWGFGRNVGLQRKHVAALEQKVRYLHHKHRRKVSIVGWSLGGAFALVAMASSVGNLLNSRLVRTMPLVPLIRWALLAAVLTAALALGLAITGIGGVWALVLAMGLFFVAFGPIAANGTTLALGPHATHAGAAAAALGFGQTVLPALIGGIGQP